MKTKFTSRGQRYELLNKMDFCDVYYGNHNTTEEYILPCLDAEMNEFTPSTVIYTSRDNILYFYISEDATYDDILTAVFQTIELGDDITLCDAVRWANDVTQNFNYINKYEHTKKNTVGLSNSDGTCSQQAKIQWKDGGIQITI